MATRLVIAEAVAIAVLGALVSAGVALPAPFSMLAHRLLHIAAVIVFVGNVIVGALLLGLADAQGNREVDRFVSRTIQRADAVFTGPGIFVSMYNGAVLAGPGGVWRASWLTWAWCGFVATGALWAFVLVPLQHRLIVQSVALDRTSWVRTARMYTVPGLASLVAIAAVLVLMVFRPV